VQKTLELLGNLAAKITSEKEEAAKSFEEFTKWCTEQSRNFKYEIKTAKEAIGDLNAKIEKDTADAASLEAKISELAGGISKADADLKAATGVRETEAEDFSKVSQELMETINTIERAVGILRSHAALVQTDKVEGLTQALTAMVQASAISAADASKLTSLMQTSSDDSDVGAPDAAVYEGHSKSIVEVLEDLLDKAQSQLSDAQKQEMVARHNFEMVKQSLEDEMKYAGQEMSKAKADLAASGESKAAASSDLAMTEKDLEADTDGLSTLESDCASKTEDYKVATASREGELEAIAAAKEALTSKTGGAESIAYDLAQTAQAFLQLQKSQARAGAGVKQSVAMPNPNFEAVHFVRRLAREQKSEALALLASRMDSAVQMGSTSGADPFGKVRGLITDMIARLEKEASADATHKAYCDKEIAESTSKKDEKTAEIEKLTTKIDSMSAQASKLKEQVAELQKELAELATSTAEMDKIRQDEHAQFLKDKPDMEAGIEGVKMALKVLREYYAEDSPTAAKGAGENIIGLLEVVESDFSKSLAEIVAAEEAAAMAYDKTSKENAIIKTTKEQDVKYKTQEATKLDKSISETSSDLSGVQAELDAVLEYLSKLEEQCVAKPETYAERKERRAAEISGLKEALSILESETALVQKSSMHLRRVAPHVHRQ